MAAPSFEVKHIVCPDSGGTHKLFYREWGGLIPRAGAAPVLCVHGLTRNSTDFDSISTHLAYLGFTVVCVDIAGRGLSEPLAKEADYGYPQYVKDVAHLVKELGWTSLHYIGTSMGGLIGMFEAGSEFFPPIETFVINDVGPFIPKAALERIASYVAVKKKFSTLEEAEADLRERYSGFAPVTDKEWREMIKNSVWAETADGDRVERKDEDEVVVPDGGYLTFAYDTRLGNPITAAPAADVDLWAFWEKVRCDRMLLLRGEKSGLLLGETAARMVDPEDPQAPKGMKQRGMVVVPGAGHVPSLLDEPMWKLLSTVIINKDGKGLETGIKKYREAVGGGIGK